MDYLSSKTCNTIPRRYLLAPPLFPRSPLQSKAVKPLSRQESSMTLEKLDGEKHFDEDSPSVEVLEVNASGHVRDIATNFLLG